MNIIGRNCLKLRTTLKMIQIAMPATYPERQHINLLFNHQQEIKPEISLLEDNQIPEQEQCQQPEQPINQFQLDQHSRK